MAGNVGVRKLTANLQASIVAFHRRLGPRLHDYLPATLSRVWNRVSATLTNWAAA